MPTVPVYEQQIEQRPLPGFRQESVATPALLGGAADSLNAAGRGLTDAGVAAFRAQEREDMATVLGVETARKEKVIAFDADLRKNRQGANAAGVAQHAKQWWDDAAREDLAALQTDSQREVYVRRLAATRLSSLNSVSQFEAQQGEAVLVANTKAAVTAAINTAAANALNTATKKPDEVGIALQLEAITTALTALAKRRGEDRKGPNGEASPLDQMIGETTTRLHKEVLKALPPELARDYFIAHEQEIDGSERDALGEAARKETADAVGRNAAKEAIAAVGYGVDVVLEHLDKKFGSDTATLKAAHAAAKELIAAYEHGEKTRTDSMKASVNRRLLAGESWGAVARSPEYRRLLYDTGPAGVAAAQQIQDHQESLAATRTSRAASAASRSYTEAARRQLDLGRAGLDKYLGLRMDPDKLAAMSSDQIINLRTEMSDTQVQHLAEQHVQLTKSAEALAAAKLDANTFKLIANEVGLRPDEKKMSENDKARLERLSFAASTALRAASSAKGRAITDPQERYEIVKKAVYDIVRVPGFFSIAGYGIGTDLPVSVLAPDELSEALVVVPEGRVRLATIPKSFREYAQEQYAQAGKTLTQRELARAWLLNKDTWSK